MYKTIKVGASANSMKIDKALQRALPDVSRRMLRRALDSGSVFLNRKKERFASAQVATGDVIQIRTDALFSKEEKKNIPYPKSFVLYEDKNIIAINKPPFIPSQESKNTSGIHAKPYLLSYLKKNSLEVPKELYLCHRLDKETSGVLIFAKSKAICDWIMLQFKERKCKKTYEAICRGIPKEKKWEQKNFLGSLQNKEQKVKVVKAGGKLAVTNFQCVKASPQAKASLISCEPLTGRSHQLRVQLSHKGYPILGDKKYCPHSANISNSDLYEHHLLHAQSLFIQPSPDSETRRITAPASSYFLSTLKRLKIDK